MLFDPQRFAQGGLDRDTTQRERVRGRRGQAQQRRCGKRNGSGLPLPFGRRCWVPLCLVSKQFCSLHAGIRLET